MGTWGSTGIRAAEARVARMEMVAAACVSPILPSTPLGDRMLEKMWLAGAGG